MMLQNPNYDWRIKLGCPEEEKPLSVRAKLNNIDNRDPPLYIGLTAPEKFQDQALSQELPEKDRELFEETVVEILLNNEVHRDRERAELRMHNSFFDNSEKGFTSKLLRKTRIGSDDTSLGLEDEGYVQHNVDFFSEQLSLAQIADMYAQYIETENSEALKKEHWTERNIDVYVDEDLGLALEEGNLGEFNTEYLSSRLNEMTSPQDVETYRLGDFISSGDSLLPKEFSMPGRDAVLEQNEDTGELFHYESNGIKDLHDHIGLAAIAHSWFDSFDTAYDGAQ